MTDDLRLQGQIGTFVLLVDAQGVRATYYGGPTQSADGETLYDIDYTEQGVPFSPSIAVMMEYVAAAEVAQKAQWPQTSPQRPQEARSATQSGGGYNRPARQNNAPQQAPNGPQWVETTDDEGYSVPGCPRHKASDGRPRPMKRFDNLWKCTGKLQAGGYCNNTAPIS